MLASALTKLQKQLALRAVNLIKKKKSGKLKGCSCADGSSQRSLYEKSETSLPTVATDLLMCSIIIDAREGWDVATANVTGAYLNADMDKFNLMKLTGEEVDIMLHVCKSYQELVAYESSKPVIYVRLKKALYGYVRSALLWYELFANTLKDMGFQLNPYDACIANKMINGAQCNIAWYVDNNKISHVDPNVVSEAIEKIDERFGKMTVMRGKEHIFLGMKFTYNNNSTVSVSMKTYLEESILESGLCIEKKAATPAKKYLFLA
jgi:Reverse transcriptase (RNA-dependent DNA polymerase)